MTFSKYFKALLHDTPTLLLHLSFAVILAGGIVAWLRFESHDIVLYPDRSSQAAATSPLDLRLDSFIIEDYPGSDIPRDYISYITAGGERHKVSVNHYAVCGEWRIYQSSYTPDGGTVLAINRDGGATEILFAGYALFAISGIILLFPRTSRLRRMLRTGTVSAMVLFAPAISWGSAIAGVPKATADSLSHKQVLYNGKVMTFNSLARDFVTKLNGSPEYRGLSAEQVVASMLLFPAEWSKEPIIRISDKELRAELGISGNRVSPAEFFDSNGAYRLTSINPGSSTSLNKAVLDADEKMGLIIMLHSGNLIKEVPAGEPRLSPLRVKIELLYNQVPVLKTGFILLFIASLWGFAVTAAGRGRLVVTIAMAISAWVILLAGYIAEWYMSGHIPLSGTGETMEFMALLIIPATLVSGRKLPIMTPAGLLLAGVVTLVANLIYRNPVMTPLMPVLVSPWLSIHVTVVMVSYTLFALMAVNSMASFASRRSALRLMELNRRLLYPAVYILGIGIITGSVWASYSWGRAWAWDPKETWALVTFVIYAVPLHRGIRSLNNATYFHEYIIVALLSVMMTYFGVNWMHSLHAYS